MVSCGMYVHACTATFGNWNFSGLACFLWTEVVAGMSWFDDHLSLVFALCILSDQDDQIDYRINSK